ncbi:unnamed protein product [Urochloa humidicola]
MADGNRSAKGKEVVVDDDDDCEHDYPDSSPIGGEPCHRWLGHPASYWSASGAAAPTAEPVVVNPYDAGYFSFGAVGWDAAAGTNGGSGSYGGAAGWDGAAATSGGGGGSGSYLGGDGAAHYVSSGGMGFLPENGGGRSTFFPPAHGMDPRMYAQEAPQHRSAPGYWWPNVNGGAFFPSPFTGAAAGPQLHAGPPVYWPAGNGGGSGSAAAAAAFPSPFTGNANGNGGATFPSPPHSRMGDGTYAAPYYAPRRSRSPLPRYREQLNTLIENSLRSLSIRDRGESLLACGRRHLSGLMSHHGRQQGSLPPPQLNAGGDLPQRAHSPAGGPAGGRGLPMSAAADPYAGRTLEDVRGAMGGVARSLPGCQFLVRMVAEGGAAAARVVFEEVAGDGEVVRLMVDAVAHELVEQLVEYWADEEIALVLQILAASPDQAVAVARDHAGSNILQTLVGRMAGNPGHAELFTSTLASVGEHGVMSLIEHPDGSRLILKCLDAFSAYQNRFISAVVSSSFFLHRLCRNKHGCNVVNRCIDKAAGDEQLLNSLVAAVRRDGIALAEHGYGNFVVQHVMSSVLEARGFLHELFRGRYVSLSRQAASSHVVQHCLELFSPEQADEIVRELLGCHRWDCTFHQLITDPYANYVLQSAMKRREIQMHYPLLDAIGAHRNSLQDDRIAKEVFRTLRKVIAGIDIPR